MSHIMKDEACRARLSGFRAELYHVLGDRGVQELGRMDESGNEACQHLAWKLSARIPLTAIKSSRGTIESVPKGVDVLIG